MADPTPILAGLRVIDAATYIAAPSAAAVLSDFGADVIKIERPPDGDPFRQLYLSPGMPKSPFNYPFLVDNRNKRSLALNLAAPEARAVFQKLVACADVLLTNYQPQMLERFELRYEDLEPLNPRLIYASITGYGEQGSEAQHPGYDMTAYYARSGLMTFLHNADAEPALSPCGFGDHPSAMTLFSGILLALLRRQQTGRGSKVWTTLMHNGVWSNSSLTQAALCDAHWPRKQTRTRPHNPLVNHYCSSDGRRFIFCLLDYARDWAKLCRAIGREDLIADPRFDSPETRRNHAEELVALLDAVFARHPMEEWVRRFRCHELLYGIVPSTQEIVQDEQMALNGVFVPVHGAENGLRTVTNPVHLDGVAKTPAHAPPAAGADTHEILAELGYSSADIGRLESAGAILRGGAR